ncbi:ACD11 homolog protein [Ricinus communis]|uniref:ACD11 homolog protein n=1 Tax=Ricinus communis TaxID=3988 RepID=UPI00201AFF24|nr:ACD11 homolog protein [Ricinus communis]
MKRYFFNTTNQDQEPQFPQQHQEVPEETAMTPAEARGQPPLSAVVEAFEDLAKGLKCVRDGDLEELRLDTFCDACSLVSVLFSCLGLAFRFAESEYVAKVCNLVDASKRHNSLKNVLDLDVENGTVRTPGSHSRNLRRVRQGLDLIRALFEQFVSTDDYSLKDAATTAYSQVCAPFHTWAVRTAVYAGMYTLPSRDQLLIRLNETDQSAGKKMRRYINASLPVIKYIDNLYISRNISLDW